MKPEPDGTIQIVEHLKDGQYEFSVSDDAGIVIRPISLKWATPPNLIIKQETLPRSWNLRVKATVEEKFSGTISVESEPGRGTRFLIRIPAGALVNLCVSILSKMIFLSFISWRISWSPEILARSAATAAESRSLMKLLRARPDVVLVDFFMPVMDGVEFVRELRSFNATIKCIMISQVSAKELISKVLPPAWISSSVNPLT